MAFCTPTETSKNIQYTPNTKSSVCVLCGESVSTLEYRRRLFHGCTKTANCFIIEKFLQIQLSPELHTDSACRKCIRDLTKVEGTIERMKGNYSETIQKLRQSHGYESTKRLTTDEEPQKEFKRKALFTSKKPENQDTEASVGPIQISISYPNAGVRNYNVDKKLEGIARALAKGDVKSLGKAIIEHSELSNITVENVMQGVNKEVKHLCSKNTDSVLRQTSMENLVGFSWVNISQEWREKAPIFYKFLEAATSNPSQEHNKTKKGENLLPGIISAGCKLVNVYNRDMNLLKYINSLLMLKGGCKKSAFARLNGTYDCLSYPATLSLQERLGSQWETEMNSWKEAVQNDTLLEDQLLLKISDVKKSIDAAYESGDPNGTVEAILLLADLETQLEEHRKSMHPWVLLCWGQCGHKN